MTDSPLSETRETRYLAREIKYFVSPGCAARIREFARARMEPDPHAAGSPTADQYRISSLYFDTPAFDVLHRVGSYGRAKYRIRRYGESGGVFLERKLRTREMLSKRRTAVGLDDLGRLETRLVDESWCGRWFHRRIQVRRLEPVLRIAYTRTARVGYNTNGLIRLTLDEDLLAAPAREFRFDDSPGPVAIGEGLVIVEMKFRRDLPLIFKEIVREFGLYREGISKYRLAATALGYCSAGLSNEHDREAAIA
jgi:hypothetical protein